MMPHIVVLVVLSTLCHVPVKYRQLLWSCQWLWYLGYVFFKLAFCRLFQFLTFCLPLVFLCNVLQGSVVVTAV